MRISDWSSDVCSSDLSSGLRRACNFHAISRMGSRNKIQVASQVGRFGIGFVSVFQITDRPVVRSGNTELPLDPAQRQGVTRKNEDEPGTEIEITWETM